MSTIAPQSQQSGRIRVRPEDLDKDEFSSAFSILEDEFRRKFKRSFRVSGNDGNNPMHLRLHGAGRAHDIGGFDLSEDEGNWLVERGNALGLDVGDYRKNWRQIGGTGPHIHVDYSDRLRLQNQQPVAPPASGRIRVRPEDVEDVPMDAAALSGAQTATGKAQWGASAPVTRENVQAMRDELLTGQHVKDNQPSASSSGLLQPAASAVTSTSNSRWLQQGNEPLIRRDAKGNPLTWDGYPAIRNSDGSFTTERSITVTDKRLNGGRPTNIPSVWQGRQLPDKAALALAIRSGKQFPAFGSTDEAVAAAQARSDEKGKALDQSQPASTRIRVKPEDVTLVESASADTSQAALNQDEPAVKLSATVPAEGQIPLTVDTPAALPPTPAMRAAGAALSDDKRNVVNPNQTIPASNIDTSRGKTPMARLDVRDLIENQSLNADRVTERLLHDVLGAKYEEIEALKERGIFAPVRGLDDPKAMRSHLSQDGKLNVAFEAGAFDDYKRALDLLRSEKTARESIGQFGPLNPTDDPGIREIREHRANEIASERPITDAEREIYDLGEQGYGSNIVAGLNKGAGRITAGVGHLVEGVMGNSTLREVGEAEQKTGRAISNRSGERDRAGRIIESASSMVPALAGAVVVGPESLAAESAFWATTGALDALGGGGTTSDAAKAAAFNVIPIPGLRYIGHAGSAGVEGIRRGLGQLIKEEAPRYIARIGYGALAGTEPAALAGASPDEIIDSAAMMGTMGVIPHGAKGREARPEGRGARTDARTVTAVRDILSGRMSDVDANAFFKANKLTREDVTRIAVENDLLPLVDNASKGRLRLRADEVTDVLAPVDAAAHQAATSPHNDLAQPSARQIEAGNYAKGHTKISGLDVTIENPAGSTRRPEWPPLESHYGYLKRTSGADGENLDVFIKPGTPTDYNGPVYVVDQMNRRGGFDEHKALIGFPDEASARKGYAENYTKDWKIGPVREFRNPDEFKDWLRTSDTTKPATEDGSRAPSSRVNLLDAPQGQQAPAGVRRLLDERRQIQEKAAIDEHTGLQNKNQWLGAQRRVDADPRREVVALDVNDLKKFNDRVGHDAGDDYIAHVGKVVIEEAQKLGISPRQAYRTGGDEIVIDAPKGKGKELLAAVKTRVAEFEQGGIKGSISGGVGPTAKKADVLLYADKRQMKAAAAKAETRQRANERIEAAKRARVSVVEGETVTGMTPGRSGTTSLSNEELNRVERFFKTGKGESVTSLGRQPDAPLRPGEAVIAIAPDGRARVVNSSGVIDEAAAIRKAQNVLREQGTLSVSEQAMKKAPPALVEKVETTPLSVLADKSGLTPKEAAKGQNDIIADGSREFSGEATQIKRALLKDGSGAEAKPTVTSEQAKASTDNNSRVVKLNVDGTERAVRLTEEQAQKWDEAAQRHQERLQFFKRGSVPELAAKQIKGEAMRYAAEKRQIAGELTGKEKAAAATREATNYIGKRVEVGGKDATVIGTPYGKIKVKFKDGKTRTVSPDEIGKSRTVPEGFKESEKGAITIRTGTQLDFGGMDNFRSPLSNLEQAGAYERRGGAMGRQASDLIRQAQVDISSGALTQADALRQLSKDLKPVIQHFKANGKPGLAEQLTRHIYKLRTAGEPFENISGLLRTIQYNTKLRFNVKSRAVNELQPLSTLWPYVSTREFAGLIVEARKPSTQKRLDGLGVFSTGNKVGATPAKSRIPDFFGKASDYNRAMGYLHGEKDAARLGLTGNAAHRHAMDWAKRVEFDSSKWDAPPILSGPVASVLGQFKGFTIKNIESIVNDLKLHQGDRFGGYAARAGKRVLAQLVVGGVRSIPGAKQIGGLLLVGAVAKALTKAGLDEETANKAAEAIYYGAPSLIGEDLSGSSMILDEPFGNNAYEKIVNFLGGPTLSMGAKLATEGQKAYTARTPEDRLEAGKRAANAVTPYYKMGESFYKVATGDKTIDAAGKEVELNRFEMAMRGLGFTPVKQTKAYDERDAAKDSSAALKLAKDILQAKAPAGGLTVEQREKAKERRTFEEEIRKSGTIPKELKDELGKGNITSAQFVDMLKRGKKSELENAVGDLSFNDALDVYSVATQEEKKLLKPVLFLKLKAVGQLPPSEQKKTLDKFRELIKQ